MEFLKNENGELYLDMEALGKSLGYNHPRESVNTIWQRHKTEMRGFSGMKTMIANDGKKREMRFFTEEGCYMVAMLSNTPKAAAIRYKLALILKKYRNELEKEGLL